MGVSHRFMFARKGVEQGIATFAVTHDNGTSYIDEMSLDMVEEEITHLTADFDVAVCDKKKDALRSRRVHFNTAKWAIKGLSR